MNLELNGKKAIITGGSRGIGKAIATALSAEGVVCTLIARNRTTLEVSAKNISKLQKILCIVLWPIPASMNLSETWFQKRIY